jgi:hypothetical protein
MEECMKMLLALLVLLLPVSLEAQKKPEKNALPKTMHADFNLVSVSAVPDTVADTTATISPDDVFLRDSGSTVIHATQAEGFAVTDNDGTDGEASVTIGGGSYQVFARPVGKPGRSCSLNDVSLVRAKGKSGWVDVSASMQAGDWTVTGKCSVNLRFYEASQ